MRRLSIAALFFALSVWGVCAHASEPEITLRIVGGLAGQPIYTAKEEPFWQSRIVAATGGRLKGEITPFDRSGIRADEIMGLVQLGTVPFGTAQLAGASVTEPLLLAADLPGLNPDFAALRANAASLRPILEARLRAEHDLELLAVYTYPAQVVFCARPFANLAQLGGRRVRSSSAAQSRVIEAFGGIPVIVPFAQLVDAVQKQVVDCAITGAMSGNILGLHRVTTHINPISFTFGPAAFLANGAAWRRIPRDLQEIIRAELAKLETEVWDLSENGTMEGIACNTGVGPCANGTRGTMTLVPAAAADERRMRDILQNVVLPDWFSRCGEVCRLVWSDTLAPKLRPLQP